MNNNVIPINGGSDFMAEPIIRYDECKLVNDIIDWRMQIGNLVNPTDYLDFTIPRTAEELADMMLAVNSTFASFGMPYRVGSSNGVIIPTFEMKGAE